MGFMTISHDAAKHSHQKYYDSDFEVIPMTRSGWYDFPPLSFAYGISDFGSWGGLISTDGQKIVVTRSKYSDRDEVSEMFEIKKIEVQNVDVGVFKTNLMLNDKVAKLTKGSVLTTLLIFFGFCFYIVPGLILMKKLPQKIFQFRSSNEFKNIDQFNSLLKK